MKRVVLYLRVSTDEQANSGFSIKEQKERLIAFCTAKGWVIVEIFIDAGWSGATLSRPAMESMIDFVSAKKCDAVLVYKLDRLSRSQKDTLYLIEDLFLPNNVDFVSMQESFDTSTPFGRAMVGILSVFAQLERETIKERTFMGRVGRAKDGKWHGCKDHPIGYDYIDGELVINETEAEQVRMVYDLYASGHSISDIQCRMDGYTTKHGDWRHPGTIANVLDNELYSGTIHFDYARAPDSHKPIIDRKTFEKVQALRKSNANLKYNQKASKHLLTGFLHCQHCGARYFAKKAPNGKYIYTCHSRAKVNKKMIKDRNCKNKNWEKHELESAVGSEIAKFVHNPSLITSSLIASKEDLLSLPDTVQEEIENIDHQIKKLMSLYQFNDQMPVEQIAAQIETLYKQKTLLSPEKRDTPSKDFNVEGLKLLLKDYPVLWENGDTNSKRYFMQLLFDKILVDGENINFVWSL